MAINLEKGQRISLAKEGGGSLEKVFMGLCWDVAKSKGGGLLGRLFGGGKAPDNIDLDASCLMRDAAKNNTDIVYFRHLKSKDGSVVHTGDNLAGEDEGDDEAIRVDLSRAPPNVNYLVFTVNSYRGQTFNEVDNAFRRLVDEKTGKELAAYKISGGGEHTAMIMSKLYRHNGEWKMRAVGESLNARTANDMVEPVKAILKI